MLVERMKGASGSNFLHELDIDRILEGNEALGETHLKNHGGDDGVPSRTQGNLELGS